MKKGEDYMILAWIQHCQSSNDGPDTLGTVTPPKLQCRHTSAVLY